MKPARQMHVFDDNAPYNYGAQVKSVHIMMIDEQIVIIMFIVYKGSSEKCFEKGNCPDATIVRSKIHPH